MIKQLNEVHKITAEVILHQKYTEMFSRRMTKREYNKLVKEFKKDCKIIAKINPMYKDIK